MMHTSDQNIEAIRAFKKKPATPELEVVWTGATTSPEGFSRGLLLPPRPSALATPDSIAAIPRLTKRHTPED